MKCDKCKAQEATVHEVAIKGGKRVEKHLCEQCAKQEGYQVQSYSGPQQVLQALIAQQAQAATPGAAADTCPCCGMKFASFRQSGLLGCADCYSAFASHLAAPLERWHEGGTHHVGKTPRRGRAPVAPGAPKATPGAAAAALAAVELARRRVDTLRRQLAEAVEGEQYERAAKLRDEIRRIENEVAAGFAAPPVAPGEAPESGAPPQAGAPA